MLTFNSRCRSAAKDRLKRRGTRHQCPGGSSRRIALSGAAPRNAARRPASAPSAELNLDVEILAAAYALHDFGMQVAPVPRASMGRHEEQPRYGSLKMLANAFLYSPLFPQLFKSSNLAVMVGKQSENLFVINCASPAAFDWVQAQLARLHIAAWVSSTDRGSCFWLRCAEGVIRNGAPSPDIAVLGSNECILCPPSLSSGGVSYRWLDRPGAAPPVVSVAQIDFFRLEVEEKGTNSLTSKSCQMVDDYGIENAFTAKRRRRQEARNVQASERLLRQKVRWDAAEAKRQCEISVLPACDF